MEAPKTRCTVEITGAGERPVRELLLELLLKKSENLTRGAEKEII